MVHAGEAARQFLEVRAGETLTDPIDLEIRGHCEAVVAFDDGLRPEMTIAELADHFDEIQRLAEARADATSPPPGANISGVTHGRAQPLTRLTVRSGRPLVDPRVSQPLVGHRRVPDGAI